MGKSSTVQNILDEIQQAKQEMENYWILKQMVDQKYLEASQRVDELINQYEKDKKSANHLNL